MIQPLPLRRHAAHRLHDALQHVDILSHRDQQSERAAMYSTPESTPPQATAPGKVRCGSWISSPMTEASSSPTSAKQITPNEFRTKRGFAGIRKSAAVTVGAEPHPDDQSQADQRGRRDEGADAAQIVQPFAHAQAHNVKDHQHGQQQQRRRMANALLSARAAWLGPSTNTETPTKYSITVGTYSMLLVQ